MDEVKEEPAVTKENMVETKKITTVVKRKKSSTNKMPKPKKIEETSILSKDEVKDALLMAMDPKNISETLVGFDVVQELKKEKGVIYKKIEPPKLKNEFLKKYVDEEDFGRSHFVKKIESENDMHKEFSIGGVFAKSNSMISARDVEMNVNAF